MANDNDQNKSKPIPPISLGDAKAKKTSSILARMTKIRPNTNIVGGGWKDRLRNLSRRDAIFIATGLAILILAPLAEHFMLKPASESLLTTGFGSRQSDGASGDLYEPGTGGMAPGGEGGETITPLSARDPSSLWIIPGDMQEKPLTVPSLSSEGGLKDAVSGAARNAFSEANRFGGAPTPKPQLQATLRGLALFGSGGSSSAGTIGGGKILDAAKGAPSMSAQKPDASPRAPTGIKGMGTPNSVDRGNFESMKSRAGSAADRMNESGAVSALDKAAGSSIDAGSGYGGSSGPGSGEKDGKTSNSSVKHEKSAGESLEMMRRKMEMQKEIDFKWKKKEFKELEIPKMLITAAIDSIVKKGFLDPIGTAMAEMFQGAPEEWVCVGLKPKKDDCGIVEDRKERERGGKKDMKEADKNNRCPCGIMPAKQWDAEHGGGAGEGGGTTPGGGGGTTPGGGTGGGGAAPSGPTGKEVDRLLTQVKPATENLENNVKQGKSELGSDNLKSAHTSFKGAVTAAGGVAEQEHAGNNIVKNKQGILEQELNKIPGLVQNAKSKVEAANTSLSPFKNKINGYGAKLRANSSFWAEYQKYIYPGSKSYEEFKKNCDLKFGESIRLASAWWKINKEADGFIKAADKHIADQNRFINNVNHLSSQIKKGLAGVQKSEGVINSEKTRAESGLTSAEPLLNDPAGKEQAKGILIKVLKEFEGAGTAGGSGGAGSQQAIDESLGIVLGLKTLFGNAEERKPEADYSDAYAHKGSGTEPKGYFSIVRIAERIDKTGQAVGEIQGVLTATVDGLIQKVPNPRLQAEAELKNWVAPPADKK